MEAEIFTRNREASEECMLSGPKDVNIWKCKNIYCDKMVGRDMKRDGVILDEGPGVQVQKAIRLHESNELKPGGMGIETQISSLLYMITKMLDIPLIRDVKELHGDPNFILFASRHDNRNEATYLKNIIVDVLERSNKKIIVAAEDFSDESVYKLLNDPKMDVDSKVMQAYLATFSYPDIAKEVIKAFREIQQKYGTDRFEIVPIGATIKDTEDMLENKISKEKFFKERDATMLGAALKLYETNKDTATLLVYAGAIHIIDILKNIMSIEGVKKEEIKKNVGVFVPPEFGTIKRADPTNTLPGGLDEFVHEVGPYGSIYLRIPVDEVKNIKSAITEADKEGLKAKVIESSGYEYLQIYKEGYDPKDDQEVVKKLTEVAQKVSKEDYLDHIAKLNFQISQDNNFKSSNIDTTQNDLNSLVNRIIVKEIEKLCNDLGIPIISVEESSSYPIVIFASKHDNSDTEPYDLKKILRQKLNNGKKTILGLEFPSDKGFEDLINDPAKNLTNPIFNEIFAVTFTGETLRELVKVFNEIQQEYPREKFEIKLIDLTRKELSKFEMDMLVDFMKKPAGTLGPDYEHNVLIVKDVIHRILDYERSVILVKNILDLLSKTYEDNNDLVIWTGALHVLDSITRLKESIESGNKDEIKKNKIAVVLSRGDLSNAIRK